MALVALPAAETEPPSVDAILPRLLLANAAFANDRARLKGHLVRALLSVTPTPHPHAAVVQRTVAMMQVCVDDDKTSNLYDHLDGCVKFIERSMAAGNVVCVHCHQGVSRSVAVVVAFLIWRLHMTLRDALSFVLDHRSIESPPSHPNSGFLMQLVRWEKRHLARDEPSLEFLEYTREAHRAWNGRNRGPCAKNECVCRLAGWPPND